MGNQFQPIQKIIFGSPGTGKSYKIREIAEEELLIGFDEANKTLSNTVKTVFHPEYTYSDFMGKLLPLTYGGSIVYKYYPGHFLKALGMAYRSLVDGKEENYLLVIDELNRGNAAAIFGSVFQLLDREEDGWSTYEVDISEMELVGLFDAMGYKANVSNDGVIQINGTNLEYFSKILEQNFKDNSNQNGLRLFNNLQSRKINIPSNLSIIATINTSDESIYYLDSAFKRRWDWEYVDAPSKANMSSKTIPDAVRYTNLPLSDAKILDWYRCIVGVNEFIKSHSYSIRRIEDKLISWWFIKPKYGEVTLEQVQDKLMFYLWDGVFARNKQLLTEFIRDKLNKKNISLVTFTDFLIYTIDLLEYWHDSVPTVEEKDDIDVGF
ncbi:restriction endonuclease [Brasilonema octagenarum UFV-E1]|uniref:Restriction endonuclease n=2 Tax=Brasilonema TaxID=383614 RepID=A0A856MHU4_9CYAN|nr:MULTISPECIES: restriction endonuclease [Brasilonema]NMF62973.1 restriction endonuclease [Brasilonema octagenarum UFV-OR1]QDL08546.1 restriction endonuclease [Brasilonema sennae CENA114]QDL14901.1 restriction endonuclease [Brasilonema octagenarum UFV-E1]